MLRPMLTVTPQLCTGCRICELMCSLTKVGELNVRRARLRVKPGNDIGAFDPMICRHCAEPACFNACPYPDVMSINSQTGAVEVSEEKCTACYACVEACSFGAIQLDFDGTILKCDLCGGDPACARYCPTRPANSLPRIAHAEQSCLQYGTFAKDDAAVIVLREG